MDKKGSSCNDFALVSKGLLNNNNEFHVHNLTAFYDHCPIVLQLFDILKINSFSLPPLNSNKNPENHSCKMLVSYNFDTNCATEFLKT